MATLDEVPREVVNYFVSKGVFPKTPKDDQQIFEEKLEAKRKADERAAMGLPPIDEDAFEIPDWLQEMSDKMLQSAVSQGIPRDMVEFSIKHGLPTCSVHHLIDVIAFRKGVREPVGLWYKRKKEYSLDGVCKVCFFLPIDCSAVPCNHAFACQTCMADMIECITCEKKIARVHNFPNTKQKASAALQM